MATLAPEPAGSDNSITALLAELSAGNRDVETRLIPQVYGELRRLAAHYMRLERGNHTLQPTALVNEAYTRLVQQPQIPWQNRAHFFATASQLMRHILVDHARARRAGKRGGVHRQVTLDDSLLPSPEQAPQRTIDVLILDQALENLAQFDPRQARIVELHFFGGLTFAEIALVLKVTERTVKRDWSMARAWLKGELSNSP
jgi:RNA polymerase sigma factor (TIGR02999 family)